MSDSTDLIRLLADEEKPREKALNQGIAALTDAELLAILLRVGIKGKSVLTVAREILRIHDNDLAKLARQTPRALAKIVPGIGPTKAITLIAALELGLRARGAMARSMASKPLAGSEMIYEYMRPRLELLTHEEFWVIMLNNNLKPMACERVSQGGIATTIVDIRILFKKVLDHQASTIAVCHNHPSGNLTPSIQDDELTKRIASAAKLLDIRLLDHLILSPTGFYSYHDQNRL
ncbi:MAG: DNA repair protein RadC [Muribaculaceae bacterium]|nr:DNA repair protein RadC [Muribaculaceae bacterium]